MTYTEYDQKKRECWENFKFARRPLNTDKKVFDYIFEHAFALGKEKEIISQDEIDEAAEDYVSFEKGGKCYPSYIVERACCRAFKDGANFALGKQEKEADIVIQGWVCRDEDGSLHLFTEIPTREYSNARKEHWWYSESSSKIDSNLFADLTWDSDPEPVEIILKRKKNG